MPQRITGAPIVLVIVPKDLTKFPRAVPAQQGAIRSKLLIFMSLVHPESLTVQEALPEFAFVTMGMWWPISLIAHPTTLPRLSLARAEFLFAAFVIMTVETFLVTRYLIRCAHVLQLTPLLPKGAMTVAVVFAKTAPPTTHAFFQQEQKPKTKELP